MIGAVASGQVIHTSNIQTGFKEISSGQKTVTTTSPAILEIGRRLLNASTFADARNRNITNQISKSRTEGAFVQNSQDTLARINELSVRANSGILNANDKEALQIEAQELAKTLNFNSQHAKFNGKQILNDEEFSNVASSLQNIDFSSSEGIKAAADAATSGIDTLAGRQARLGTEQIVLEQQFKANLDEQKNLLEAGSKLVDTDVAQAFTNLTRDVILSDVSSALSSQAASLESSRVAALLT